MKQGRVVIRLGPLLMALQALVFAPCAFSWDPYAVDGFSPAAAQAPLPAYQRSGPVAWPGMAPNAVPGKLQRRWYAPLAERDGRRFVGRLPVGGFRPLESTPPPLQRGYQGYNFRPLGPESGSFRPAHGLPRAAGTFPNGGRIGPGGPLPGAGQYRAYGPTMPRFSFRPERQPVRQPSEGRGSLDPILPPLGTEHLGGFHDVPAPGHYGPQIGDGPSAGEW